MPRLVRRTPLIERIKAYLDPNDFLLWLSEELNDDAYDELLKAWGIPIGIALNIIFILARGSSKPGSSRRDDVFGDGDGGAGWFSWVAAFVVHLLTVLSCWNAYYAFFRTRHYRLFEQPIDEAPRTTSAHRVRVASSPVSSSPLRFLQTVMSTATAASRAEPDPEREVWELSIWDPKPFNLTMFTLFSPGHVLMYYLMLPPALMDPRPSTTVTTTIALAVLLSAQMSFLKNSFSQQAKDSTLVHGEVLNEYDTKFVRPSLQRPVRDVGIQAGGSASTPRGAKTREVDVYTPTTIVNRGFRPNPNPNYEEQVLIESERSDPRTSGMGVQRSVTSPSLVTPSNAYAHTNGYAQSSAYSRQSLGGPDYSSPLKPHHERLRERTPMKNESGSSGYLGVQNHAASPLRKTVSSSQLPSRTEGTQTRQAGSPLKRMSTPGGAPNGLDGGARRRQTERF